MDISSWIKEIRSRFDSIARFARLSGSGVDAEQFVWSHGRYLVLHFELVTTIGDDKVDRSNVYDSVAQIVKNANGTWLGGSVDIVPLLPNTSSERSAALFWNALEEETRERLLPGDAFYVHYAPDVKNLMGGIGQVVPLKMVGLSRVKVPPA